MCKTKTYWGTVNLTCCSLLLLVIQTGFTIMNKKLVPGACRQDFTASYINTYKNMFTVPDWYGIRWGLIPIQLIIFSASVNLLTIKNTYCHSFCTWFSSQQLLIFQRQHCWSGVWAVVSICGSWYSQEVTTSMGRLTAESRMWFITLELFSMGQQDPKECEACEENGDLTYLARWHAPYERNSQVF